MATTAMSPETVQPATLVNYLISMARTVEGAVNRAIEAALTRNGELASQIFLLEPRVNEMEIVIDEYAVRLLRTHHLQDDEIRLIVASLKINNDLERMADLAVNIGQRVVSLEQMPEAPLPEEFPAMSAAVKVMVNK